MVLIKLCILSYGFLQLILYIHYIQPFYIIKLSDIKNSCLFNWKSHHVCLVDHHVDQFGYHGGHDDGRVVCLDVFHGLNGGSNDVTDGVPFQLWTRTLWNPKHRDDGPVDGLVCQLGCLVGHLHGLEESWIHWHLQLESKWKESKQTKRIDVKVSLSRVFVCICLLERLRFGLNFKRWAFLKRNVSNIMKTCFMSKRKKTDFWFVWNWYLF